MSLLGVLSIARDGLLAQTAGLDITGQNVANASTPGYVKRSALLETRALGSGEGTVVFAGLQRSFEKFSFARATMEQAKGGAASARSDALARVEQILAPGAGSIGEALGKFFDASQALVASPADPSARQELLARADALATTVSGAASDLARTKDDLFQKASGVAGEVNEKLAKIADLSKQIALAKGIGDGAASLRDQRDNLVRDVSERIGAQAIEDDAGHYTLLSSGVALVTDGAASSLGVTLDQSGALQIKVTQPGGQTGDITNNVTSGTLGGIREARDTDLTKTQSDLDQFAFDLAGAVNAVHAAGFGLDGVGNRNLFAQPGKVSGAAYAMQLDATMVGHPERLAASDSVKSIPGGNANALALAGLASKAMGSGTPSERYASMTAALGSAKSSADSERALRDSTLAQAKTMEQSASGVSLDEEMVDLSKFQRAFEASSKVLKTADDLLAGLMQELR